MKQVILSCGFLLSVAAQIAAAQTNYADSIRNIIYSTPNDSLKMKQFIILTEFYRQTRPDSSFYYAKKLLEISQKLDLKLNQGYALAFMGFSLNYQNKFVESLKSLNAGLALLEDPQSEQKTLPSKYSVDEDLYDHPLNPHLQRLEKLATLKIMMVQLYHNVRDSVKEFELIKDARALSIACGNKRIMANANVLAAIGYFELKQFDSALASAQRAYEQSNSSGLTKYLSSVMFRIGSAYKKLGQRDKAVQYYWQAIQYGRRENYLRGVFAADLELSNWHLQLSQLDSSLWYARDAQSIAAGVNLPDLKLRSDTSLLALFYASRIRDSMLKYQSLIIQYKDSAYGSQVKFQVELNKFKDEQLKQDEIASARKEYLDRVRTYGFLIGLAAVFIIAFILWKNNRNIQKANKSLKTQKEETEKQKAKVEQMFSQLQSTQAQLIQSEKMASLGELTAGIAHEIQNPLNFVNNFSEVNTELFEEMEKELNAGNSGEAFQLAANIRQNLDKISQHGKRADAIVKSMLQHSRVSTRQKEASDLNSIAEETLRLSFLGMRAKDTTFNCEIKTSFDPGIGKVDVIPEDFRRVLLNMYNNSFYSISQKIRRGEPGFKPELALSTSAKNGQVEIKVRDNGMGIPKRIMDKIFQPFFTTKPAGHGTGLGLSLSYDIIVNEHSGELAVDSEEGNFAVFTITLPLSKSA